jgi:hypothetical protein
MAESVESIRVWAKKCADATRGRMPEYHAWDLIAERGQEWDLARRPNGKPYRGGPMMTKKMCFWNSARVVSGLTAFDSYGCQYAEGFALSRQLGLWFHHAWVVNSFGLVIDRTWNEPGDRYIGVTFTPGSTGKDFGCCQLDEYPLGTAWGPALAEQPAIAKEMWGHFDD